MADVIKMSNWEKEFGNLACPLVSVKAMLRGEDAGFSQEESEHGVAYAMSCVIPKANILQANDACGVFATDKEAAEAYDKPLYEVEGIDEIFLGDPRNMSWVRRFASQRGLSIHPFRKTK